MNDIENSYDEHVPTTVNDMESSYDELRRSKIQKKKQKKTKKRFPLEMIFILI